MSPTPPNPWYPVNLVLEGAGVLVVGGGPIGARKVQGLLASGARVTVVAPEAVSVIRNDGRVRWHSREYRRGEVANYQLAISATGIRDVDLQVYNDARASHIPVNTADVPELCTFTLPSILRRGDLQIAVSTAGRSPAFASWVRRKLEQVVDDTLGKALEVAAEVREEVQAAGISTERPGWHEAFDGGFLDLLADGDREAARSLLLTSIGIDPQTMTTLDAPTGLTTLAVTEAGVSGEVASSPGDSADARSPQDGEGNQSHAEPI